MRSQSVNVVLGCAAAALLATSVQATLTIDTPSALAECLPTAITWKDATPPVYISAYPKGNTAGKAYTLITKADQASGSFSWTVNLTAGTTTTLGIRDKTGQVQATAPVTIFEAPSGTDDCKPIKPYDGGSDSTPASGNNSTDSGDAPKTPATPATTSKGSGSATSGGSAGGATSGAAGGAKNATDSADTTSKNGTATAGAGTDNSTVPVDGNSTTPTDTNANDAPSNLWVGSSDQNYILIISVLLSTAMAVMIGAWSE